MRHRLSDFSQLRRLAPQIVYQSRVKELLWRFDCGNGSILEHKADERSTKYALPFLFLPEG